jgi:hypothetical protein
MGVDLAKNLMQAHAVDGAGRVVVQKAIARERFVSWFANLEPCVGAASNSRETDGLKLTTDTNIEAQPILSVKTREILAQRRPFI